MNSASGEPQATVQNTATAEQDLSDQWFTDRFESLLPTIQERWPEVARQTLEATRGSLDEVVRVIAQHSGKTKYGVKEQLEELLNSATDRTKNIAESLEPLEKQLEELLDELNTTLRPKVEKPIRQRPLLAVGIAASIGLLIGLAMSGDRRTS